MNTEELIPHFEEMKKVLNGKIDDDQLRKELDTYLNAYHVTIEAAKRGIMRKYGVGDTSSFVTANTISKKVGDLKGNEMNVDITAKTVYVDKKEITVRGNQKIIISGIIGDETGTAPFTIWEGENVELEKGEIYLFKNAYTKKWNDRVQINLGSRGKIEPIKDIKIDVTEKTITIDSQDMKIGDIHDGVGNVTVSGRIISVEARNIIVKEEPKVVYSGIIADNSGKIQFSAWNDYGLKEGESICVKNAYIRAWRGIPQLNLGDKCEVSRIDDSFGQIDATASKKTVADIIKIGGGLDISVTGTVVDLRTGSGLIKRCPECNRSVLNDQCTTHGQITPVLDLRMKLVIDDGTGAISAIVNCEDTTKLTGITLEAAKGLAQAKGEIEVVGRDMAPLIIMKKITVTGNVMSDDYGPMMIVKSANIEKTDVIAEAEKLYNDVEAAL
ncbi:MAG: single-stranded DNA-binding protein [Candidatus Methanomethylophilaceae archaeon]|nr:single-stranded DNA-binding protein [Candidatus Methanomethylophilaceae archaeon]MDD3378894.1 single-stranded DNA-binding protein [Candidatus Methanomethylophilaceae archaeon]MDY0223909.1 single-stranded DNA-binding protein [Candidatus Methanomethylophilaceae archaeon]